MSRNQRLGLIAFAAVVIVAAFVVLRPTEQSGRDSSRPATQTTTSGGETRRPEAKPRPPQVAKVRIVGGKPAEQARTISLGTGQQGRIDVTSDTRSVIHLHGYEIERPVAPGKTTKLRFKADIEGVFELEDHTSGQGLASVEVAPR